jgi:hypothetical protein
MKSLSLLFLIAVIDCSVAQTLNVQAVAYSRVTTPGIPTGLGGPAINSLPVRYYIYVTVKKGTPVSVSSVCLKGQSYAASLKKVTSPVVVPHDPNVPTEAKDMLVPKTQDEVYQVNLQEQTGPACDDPAQLLARENEVVVALKSRGTPLYAPAKTIVALAAAAAP